MAFTQVTVVGSFSTPSGAAAAGSLTFTLTQPMANGSIIDPSPVTVTLDGSGHFSVSLAATDDPATVPQGVQYGVTETLTGAQPRDYFITVPHATSPVDISTLMPDQPGWN